LLKLLKRFTII